MEDYSFTYNKQGETAQINTKTTTASGKIYVFEYSYKYKYDDKGNWIEKKCFGDDDEIENIEERILAHIHGRSGWWWG